MGYPATTCAGFITTNDRLIPYTVRIMTIDPPLTIESLKGSSPGTVVLRLTGTITMNTVAPLRALFREGEPPSHLILDFGDVAYMDSAGMSEIISHEVYCREKGVRMTLAGGLHLVVGQRGYEPRVDDPDDRGAELLGDASHIDVRADRAGF